MEYLDELNREHGGEEGVLRWASLLSGVQAETIEALAVTYAKTKPACLHSTWTCGGAQRTGNGMYHVWLLLCLAAMTGNATVRGGGIGALAPVDGMAVKLGKAPAMCKGKKHSALLFSQYMQSKVLLTGRDSRTPEQIRADVLGINGIDLGPDAKIEIDMVWRGGGSADPFNQRSSINPKILAWKKLDYVVSYERFMSTTARYSDLVLPVVTHLEESFFTGSPVKTDMNVVNALVNTMYEDKSDVAIHEKIAERLGLDWGRHGMTDHDVMRIQWQGTKLPEAYKSVDPDMKLPTFEEMLERPTCSCPFRPKRA